MEDDNATWMVNIERFRQHKGSKSVLVYASLISNNQVILHIWEKWCKRLGQNIDYN